jgi:hypothetical protein
MVIDPIGARYESATIFFVTWLDLACWVGTAYRADLTGSGFSFKPNPAEPTGFADAER